MSIKIQKILKTFGDYNALNGVDLEVRPGELVALLGPSGSGKTTLLRIIAGLEFADSGQVLIDGQESSSLNVRDRDVGFVFQHYALFKHMTVFDNVSFGLRVRAKETRPSDEEIQHRVMSLLKLVHLDQFFNRYPSQLSGGQRQRVALARSLAVEPKLLLLDEPFGALDAKVRKELRRWLRRLHDDIHITTIFVTHDQEEAMEVADRVVVMNQGRIEQAGTPADVYHHPVNGFVYDFLGNFNEFAGWMDDQGDIHLAEDDLWEAPEKKTEAKPAADAPSNPLLARYPELGGFIKRLTPIFGREKPAAPIPHVQENNSKAMREALSKRGKPVRVYARPHEMFVTRDPDGEHEYIPTTVVHINPAGSLAKLELLRKNGSILQVEVPKTILDQLNLDKRDIVFVRPKNVRVFE